MIGYGEMVETSPIKRATRRPKSVVAPAHWTRSEPPVATTDTTDDDPLPLNPVRYGDWELKGIAIDF